MQRQTKTELLRT